MLKLAGSGSVPWGEELLHLVHVDCAARDSRGVGRSSLASGLDQFAAPMTTAPTAPAAAVAAVAAAAAHNPHKPSPLILQLGRRIRPYGGRVGVVLVEVPCYINPAILSAELAKVDSTLSPNSALTSALSSATTSSSFSSSIVESDSEQEVNTSALPTIGQNYNVSYLDLAPDRMESEYITEFVRTGELDESVNLSPLGPLHDQNLH